MQRFTVENISAFGRSQFPATEADIARVVANPSNEYHILRHYPRLPKEYSDTLVGKSYEYFDYAKKAYLASIVSEEDITTAYQTKGSKFFVNVPGIENPKKLIELIREEFRKRIANGNVFWIQKEMFQLVVFTIDYHHDVGNRDLIPIDSLSSEEQVRVMTVPRGSHSGEKSIMIKTIANIAKRPTKRISVEINVLPNKLHAYLTAYPGEPSPGFPNSNQSPEEYEYSKNFWDNHVFIS